MSPRDLFKLFRLERHASPPEKIEPAGSYEDVIDAVKSFHAEDFEIPVRFRSKGYVTESRKVLISEAIESMSRMTKNQIQQMQYCDEGGEWMPMVNIYDYFESFQQDADCQQTASGFSVRIA